MFSPLDFGYRWYNPIFIVFNVSNEVWEQFFTIKKNLFVYLNLPDLGTPITAIFQSEDEGNIRQMKEHIEMIFKQLKEMETRAGTELHYYSSRIDEFDRHANRAFENVCNMIEFLEREIANLNSNLAIAHVYLHGAFQEDA